MLNTISSFCSLFSLAISIASLVLTILIKRSISQISQVKNFIPEASSYLGELRAYRSQMTVELSPEEYVQIVRRTSLIARSITSDYYRFSFRLIHSAKRMVRAIEKTDSTKINSNKLDALIKCLAKEIDDVKYRFHLN